MKNYYAGLVSIALGIGCLLRAEDRAESIIVERGLHHNVRVNVTTTITPEGKTVLRTNRYTELVTGLNYQRNGEWVESQEIIDIVPGGALASQGAHQVGFAANINTPGAINLLTPDGKRFRSHVLGLAYTDAKTGKSILIAEVKDSIGELVGKNQIYYRNAFAGLKAEIRYTYTRAGLEQDIILRDVPPAPEIYGLDSATTRFEVFTEFIEAPAPEITDATLAVTADPVERLTMVLPDFLDQTLNFGAMRIAAGQAFPLPRDEERTEQNLPTGKTWEMREGRRFLVEAVQYPPLKTQIEALGLKEAVKEAKLNRKVGVGRTFPPAPVQAKAVKDLIKTAALSTEEAGFVFDYNITSGVTNFTFAADTTYYVGGSAYFLWGTTVIEGGTVIKYTNGAPQLHFKNAIDCRTSPYRPAIATSMHDNTVGDIITGSTGNPTNYCGHMFWLGNFAGGYFDLHDIHISHASRAFYGTSKVMADISNCQIRHVIYAFNNAAAIWNLRNVLVSEAVYGFNGSTPLTNNAEHVTFYAVSNFAVTVPALPAVNLTNSLLICVTNAVSWVGTGVETNLSGSGVFQTVGSGSYYLATNSPYRDVGTTNINPGLLVALRQRTTFPPQWLTNTISSNIALEPVVTRDLSAPDLGYHYDVLDYFASGLILSNTTVILTNGAAIGLDYSAVYWGIIFKDSKLISEGSPTNPIRIVRAHMVQERSSGNADDRALFYDEDSVGSSNELRLRFTFMSQLVGDGYMVYRGQKFSALEWSHSTFYNSSLVVDTAEGNYITCGMTNSLWERGGGQFGLLSSSANSTVHARNNLFKNFSQHFVGAGTSWTVKDNLVDGTNYVGANLYGFYDHGTTVTNAKNAYYGTTNTLSGGVSNISLTTLTYVVGPLGNYYQPTNSSLINTGSLTANLGGLYHFTTTTNQVKETNGVVDIGIHYVALTASNASVDTDGDGIPDYLDDDSDGDGIPDWWELANGLDPSLNESTQQGSRINYVYDGAGRLRDVSGVRNEDITVDPEGNIQNLSQ